MTRTIFLTGAALLALSACNARDEGNGSTVISVDKNAVAAGVDQAGNALEAAGNEVKDATEQAGPALENAADKTGAAVERAGDRVENTNVEITTTNEQNR